MLDVKESGRRAFITAHCQRNTDAVIKITTDVSLETKSLHVDDKISFSGKIDLLRRSRYIRSGEKCVVLYIDSHLIRKLN